MVFTWLDWIALFWFIFLWSGYSFYSKYKAKQGSTLSAQLYRYRKEWARNIIRSKMTRVHDAAIFTNLSSVASFLAATAIFIIAGLIALTAKVALINDVLSHYEIVYPTTPDEIMVKIIILCLIFVTAFFRLTWAMRQFSICSIMLGAAPFAETSHLNTDEKTFAKQMAKINDLAGHEFNYGLRSYYFALSVLFWFIHPLMFVLACSIVTLEIYRRDFGSKVIVFLNKGRFWDNPIIK